ncbi:transposase [Xanthomonas translucens pv. translucens]|nr:transposase [Xanthomonas translucens]UNU00350.1 transposase [Xanthomonas translucens pv. translucens]
MESFNGRLRQECLNEHWFLSLADARSKIEAWRRFYNEERPHSALVWKPLRNLPENTGPKRIHRRSRRSDFLLSNGTAIGGGSPPDSAIS